MGAEGLSRGGQLAGLFAGGLQGERNSPWRKLTMAPFHAGEGGPGGIGGTGLCVQQNLARHISAPGKEQMAPLPHCKNTSLSTSAGGRRQGKEHKLTEIINRVLLPFRFNIVRIRLFQDTDNIYEPAHIEASTSQQKQNGRPVFSFVKTMGAKQSQKDTQH